MRRLIVNADDFGQSAGVNRGVIEAHQHGIVTSASLMVRWPAAAEAAAYADDHPRFGLGLHIDLGEWLYEDEGWRPAYTVVDTADADAVAAEVAAQVAAFRRFVGREPDHLDSHQHVHREQPVRAVVEAVASELGVPLREAGGGVTYVGGFYGQTAEGEAYPGAITVDSLLALLAQITDPVTELGCHPGYDDGLTTMYRSERETEVQTLTDVTVAAALASSGIALCSFAELRGSLPSASGRSSLMVTKE